MKKLNIPDKVRIALADDHQLFRKGLVDILTEIPGHEVTIEAANGQELVDEISNNGAPDLAILDINMKVMNGPETATWLNHNHPDVKILALSMYDDEKVIINMLKAGARGYILKDCSPGELKVAVDTIIKKGFYQSEVMSKALLNTVNEEELYLNKREVEFLKQVCTEKTYKEIADDMNVSPRTVDGYRESLFNKLRVKNRVGLVLYAIRNGIFEL